MAKEKLSKEEVLARLKAAKEARLAKENADKRVEAARENTQAARENTQASRDRLEELDKREIETKTNIQRLEKSIARSEQIIDTLAYGTPSQRARILQERESQKQVVAAGGTRSGR